MDNKSIKNMVVLKNIPSNIIEEAIVILKTNRMAKNFEYIDNNANVKNKNNGKNENYIVKEAESVISSYIEKIEREEKSNKKINNNYKILRNYSIAVSTLFLLMLLINGLKF